MKQTRYLLKLCIPLSIITMDGCNSGSINANTSAGNPSTPSRNSVTSQQAAGFDNNVTTTLNVTKVNVTRSDKTKSIVSGLYSSFLPATVQGNGNLSSLASLSYGDLLTLNGGLSSANGVVNIPVINGASRTTIKNTFGTYVDDWYAAGSNQTMQTMNSCGSTVPASYSYMKTAASYTDGAIWWDNAISSVSEQYMLRFPTVQSYDIGYFPNMKKQMNVVVFFLDAKYGVSIRNPDATCTDAPIIDHTDAADYGFSWSEADALLASDAQSSTSIASGVTYSSIIEVYPRNLDVDNNHCYDQRSKTRRIVSHELGHFLISLGHSSYNDELMYPITDCYATSVLPALFGNSQIDVYSETLSPSGSLRWIP